VTTRQRLAAILLWSTLVLVGTMFGASVYQRISLIPEWGGALPQSVVLYFRGTHSGQAIDHFWTTVTPPTAVAIILALILNWPLVARRRWISRGAIVFPDVSLDGRVLRTKRRHTAYEAGRRWPDAGGDNSDGTSLDFLGLVSYGRDTRVIPLLRQGSHASARRT
jgi:hypothetical protein